MSDCITGNGVAEIYVDIHKSDAGAEQGEEQLDGSYPTKSSPMVNTAGDGDGQGGVDGDSSVGDEEADEFRTIASLNRVTSLF